MIEERWIEGFEGIYSITSCGICFSYRKGLKKEMKAGFTQRNKEKQYKFVNLSMDGKFKANYIHRLVACAFIPNPENKPCVNHIDGDKKNNRVDNLEWVTYSENVFHAVEIGLIPLKDYTEIIDNFINKGELSGYEQSYLRQLITPEDFKRNGLPVDLGKVSFRYNGRPLKDVWYDNCKIYRMLEEGYRISEISKATGFSLGTISRIKKNDIHPEGYEIYKNSLTEQDKADILDVRKINERKQLFNLKEVGPCENCGEIMEEKRSHKIFCSDSCYHKFKRKSLEAILDNC